MIKITKPKNIKLIINRKKVLRISCKKKKLIIFDLIIFLYKKKRKIKMKFKMKFINNPKKKKRKPMRFNLMVRFIQIFIKN